MDNASSTSGFDVDNEMNNEDALDDFAGRTTTGTGGMSSGSGGSDASFTASAPALNDQQQDSGLKGQALNKASELKDQAKQQAGELINRTRDEMKHQLTSQKDRVVDGLSSFAGTLRQAGDQCQTNEMSAPVADYAHQAASYLERFSHDLRNRDVDDVIREAEDFARRQPTLFIGGSFLIGMAIARFLKSGSPNRHALVPVSTYQTGGSADFAPNSLRGGNIDAVPSGEQRYTAHNYVPGVGVKSEQHDNTGSGSTFAGAGSESSGSAFSAGATDSGAGTTFSSTSSSSSSTAADSGVTSTSSGTEARSDNGI